MLEERLKTLGELQQKLITMQIHMDKISRQEKSY